MIIEVEPRLVIPCDEVAIRLLFELVRHPPRHLGGDGARVQQLVRESLGDPAHYETSIDKTMLPPAAQALGVPVPVYRLAETVNEAVEAADVLGYPVVLKRRYGFASQGVRILQHRDELWQAADALLQPMQLDLGVRRASTLLVQGFVDGPTLSQTMVAWARRAARGLCAPARSGVRAGQGRLGRRARMQGPIDPRFHRAPAPGAFSMSGLFSVQYIEPADGSPPRLLEINRRIVTFMHMDEYGGVDLCGALYQRLAGVQTLPFDMPDKTDHILASFPHEWLRDPESPWLRDHPSDIPWDDPDVLQAMVALRNE